MKYRVPAPRISARVGGNNRRSPNASVTNPGVSMSAPANSTRSPSTSSFPGARPARICSWARRRIPVPSRRTSHAPTTLTSRSNPIVGSTSMLWATWTMTYSSTIGMTTKSRTSSGNMASS